MIDPVCGMTVDPAKARGGSAEHAGTTYYFCSEGCRKKFVADPEGVLKAGPKGMYAETRADDLVIRCIRELLRRHPELPPERIDEVAIAATTQTGDQGLTIGRTAALLAGLPKTVPGFACNHAGLHIPRTPRRPS